MSAREADRRRLIDRIRAQKTEIARFLQDLDSYNEFNVHGDYIDPAKYRASMAARNADLDRMLKSLQEKP